MTTPQSTNNQGEELGEEYYVWPVGSVEHNGSGFCWDPTCPDKEDQDLINQLNGHVQSGLASPEDADRIYHGQNV